jgi:hypothetical protein
MTTTTTTTDRLTADALADAGRAAKLVRELATLLDRLNIDATEKDFNEGAIPGPADVADCLRPVRIAIDGALVDATMESAA